MNFILLKLQGEAKTQARCSCLAELLVGCRRLEKTHLRLLQLNQIPCCRIDSLYFGCAWLDCCYSFAALRCCMRAANFGLFSMHS